MQDRDCYVHHNTTHTGARSSHNARSLQAVSVAHRVQRVVRTTRAGRLCHVGMRVVDVRLQHADREQVVAEGAEVLQLVEFDVELGALRLRLRLGLGLGLRLRLRDEVEIGSRSRGVSAPCSSLAILRRRGDVRVGRLRRQLRRRVDVRVHLAHLMLLLLVHHGLWRWWRRSRGLHVHLACLMLLLLVHHGLWRCWWCIVHWRRRCGGRHVDHRAWLLLIHYSRCRRRIVRGRWLLVHHGGTTRRSGVVWHARRWRLLHVDDVRADWGSSGASDGGADEGTSEETRTTPHCGRL